VETLTLTGPATTSGVLTLYVGNVKIEVGIASADTAVEIATALKAALDAGYPDLPFIFARERAPTHHKITFTAKNKGTVANQVDFAVEVTASGVTATLAETTPGSVDPDIDDALGAVFAEDYTLIATPFNDQTSLTALRDHLDSVSGPMEQRPAVGIYGYDGVLADCTTLAGNINSGRILCAYLAERNPPPTRLRRRWRRSWPPRKTRRGP
jgi:phage tail sheath gpL-like